MPGEPLEGFPKPRSKNGSGRPCVPLLNVGSFEAFFRPRVLAKGDGVDSERVWFALASRRNTAVCTALRGMRGEVPTGAVGFTGASVSLEHMVLRG